MNAIDFTSALHTIGATTQHDAAARLGVTQSRISEWTTGARPIPPYIARLVLALVEIHELRASVAVLRKRPSSTHHVATA